jgi:hypothetical protein
MACSIDNNSLVYTRAGQPRNDALELNPNFLGTVELFRPCFVTLPSSKTTVYALDEEAHSTFQIPPFDKFFSGTLLHQHNVALQMGSALLATALGKRMGTRHTIQRYLQLFCCHHQL